MGLYHVMSRQTSIIHRITGSLLRDTQSLTSLAYHRLPPMPLSVGIRTARGKSLRHITLDWMEDVLSRI